MLCGGMKKRMAITDGERCMAITDVIFYRLGRHFLLLRGIRPPARISPPLDIQGVRVP